MQSYGCILVPMLNQQKLERSLQMRINFPLLAVVTALVVVLSLSLPAQAQGAADTYKAKCAMCHGPDGTGSTMGKKMGAHDFTGPEVQKMSDADLTDVITKGKNKMPTYGEKLKPEDIKGLVAYIRTLKK